MYLFKTEAEANYQLEKGNEYWERDTPFRSRYLASAPNYASPIKNVSPFKGYKIGVSNEFKGIGWEDMLGQHMSSEQGRLRRISKKREEWFNMSFYIMDDLLTKQGL